MMPFLFFNNSNPFLKFDDKSETSNLSSSSRASNNSSSGYLVFNASSPSRVNLIFPLSIIAHFLRINHPIPILTSSGLIPDFWVISVIDKHL